MGNNQEPHQRKEEPSFKTEKHSSAFTKFILRMSAITAVILISTGISLKVMSLIPNFAFHYLYNNCAATDGGDVCGIQKGKQP